jgi:eukaryotic-like serine/threonine-protein kinase
MLSLVRRRQGSNPDSALSPHYLHTSEGFYRRVGPYRLCMELAAGGMATVYLARSDSEHGLSRMLAIKLIHPHLANDHDFIEMFMDEAELASRIRHPNVCAVLDYDLHGSEPYLAMEYLIGESLTAGWKRIQRAQQLDPERLASCVARILADTCEGLHAAHELTDEEGELLHVVHRDVSLENVYVTYDGIAKVMDFGVAAAAHKRHRTRTGIVKGKFASVAPECLKGRKPDRRADVWGVGVIAWELLTGQRLFKRDTDVDTLRAVSKAPIRPPSERRDGLSHALDEIVLRALSRDPEERYATARELGRDLARFAASGAEIVTPADVADWLQELFPGGRERRQQILELAASVSNDEDSAPARMAARRSGPSNSPPAGVPAEPTLATSLWAGPRADSTILPPPPSASPPEVRPSTAWPGSPPTWRTWLLTFAIASAGGVSALLAQALVQDWHDRAAQAQPAPAAPDRDAHVVVGEADRENEIVLRIRIDSSAPGTRDAVDAVARDHRDPLTETSVAQGETDLRRALKRGRRAPAVSAVAESF